MASSATAGTTAPTARSNSGNNPTSSSQQPKIWDIAKQRDPSFTCANICWWYAMYSTCDYTVTPRPMYPADGRKLPDCWTEPRELARRASVAARTISPLQILGADDIDRIDPLDRRCRDRGRSSNTIRRSRSIYLPHLDYNFQRFGPDDPRCQQDLRELDAEVGKLIDHFRSEDARIILLSEYGITPVSRPIHINRVLREAESPHASAKNSATRFSIPATQQAFAVADHQIAHVYVQRSGRAAADSARC